MSDIVERLRTWLMPGLTEAEEALHNEAAEEIARLRATLRETALQIEYLDDKFLPTGTAALVLQRIKHALKESSGGLR